MRQKNLTEVRDILPNRRRFTEKRMQLSLVGDILLKGVRS